MNPAKLAQHLNEAAAHHQNGDLAEAETLYRKVLKKAPQQPDALHLLGVLLDQRGHRTQGMALIRQALAVQSAFPDAHFNLGRMLVAAGDLMGAKAHYEQALALKPGHARAHNGLGIIYRAQQAYPEACAAFERALRFEPRLLEAHINLCNTYRDTCNEVGILKVAELGLAVDPKCAQLWLLRSEALLTLGRLQEGWRDYEWRFSAAQRPVCRPDYALPLWKGEDLSSKGILVWCEQGVGDEIIFTSMVADLASRARRCVLQTTSRLAPLFARSLPQVEVFAGRVPAGIAEALDVQSAAGSLGQWCRPTFRSFPSATDYLKADPGRSAALRNKYGGGRHHSLLVGLAWRSANVVDGIKIEDAAQKTLGLNQWGAILNVPGVTFVNLQYGDNREAIAAARSEFGVYIIDDGEVDALSDLDGFAAQVAAMDLVISSSNTAAHMAGGLGVPVWCAIPRALGSGRRWYWFGEGCNSPWYRSMTLFRQTHAGVWGNLLADMGLVLTEVAACAGALDQPAQFLERLARGYKSAGMTHEAEKAYDRALAFAPNGVQALRESAKLRLNRGAVDEALPLIERALAQEPNSPDLHNLRGMILARATRWADAVAAYRHALSFAPDQAEIYNNLGTALRREGHGIEASDSYAKAHSLRPEHASISLNHATALWEIDRTQEALSALDELITLQPDYVDAHYNRALVLMALGRFEEGWKAFKWRLKRPFVHVRHEDFPQPVWSGEDLRNKHVLVWTDLGIGDEILLSSIIPDVAAAARKVTLLCSERLVALFRRSFPGVTVDRRKSPLPASALSKDVDLQMSLAELGTVFRRDVTSFPERDGYLKVDEALRATLRKKYLAGREKTLLVGISWRSANPEIGVQKSLALAEWEPILKVPGITFVNLQYGDCREEVENFRHEHGVNVIDDQGINALGDMEQVAAQTAAMDLVISVSNTTVHVAGATGVPVWVLLPQGQARLWYWFRGVNRCVWYPKATLKTSGREGDWSQLIEKCAGDLARLAGA